MIPFLVIMLFKDLIQGTVAESELIFLLQTPNGQLIAAGAIFVVSILVLAVSYLISIKIYSNKEF